MILPVFGGCANGFWRKAKSPTALGTEVGIGRLSSRYQLMNMKSEKGCEKKARSKNNEFHSHPPYFTNRNSKTSGLPGFSKLMVKLPVLLFHVES